jgi:hypothetical protein
MLVFLDFEASSLGKKSYPIEVAWVFEDGRSEAHLIRPAATWIDWNPAAEEIHHIPREELLKNGTDHKIVAERMVNELDGHDLLASAPSWDGKWLSALLRAAGMDRRALRLRDSEDAQRECARAILAPTVAAQGLEDMIEELVAAAALDRSVHVPTHRALADAQDERLQWIAVRDAALELTAIYGGGR